MSLLCHHSIIDMMTPPTFNFYNLVPFGHFSKFPCSCILYNVRIHGSVYFYMESQAEAMFINV